MGDVIEAAVAPRWRGQPDRLEVWYLTVTDPDTGGGAWIHVETVAPEHGEPFAHGWAAVFPPDTSPSVVRFGPEAVDGPPTDAAFAAAGALVTADRLTGSGDDVAFDLDLEGGGPPLFTFPEIAWEREVLPGAQILPRPSALVNGTIEVAGTQLDLVGAPGALAHIYGHGSAQRWAWLHADLGDGDVLEVVAAVSRTAGLRVAPPMAFARLRLAGEPDWPANPAASAPLSRTSLGLPRWSTTVRWGRSRLRVEVDLAPDRAVAMRYEDPDGATATCTNSEVADATITFRRPRRPERRWRLVGTAHTEVGVRP